MKTVFKSDEIAHIWANRGAPYGRSPGNASFDGDAFKSYATVIGRRITAKGKTAYVLDKASFSNSTSKIQSRLACAIADGPQVFRVRIGAYGQSLNFTPATLAAHYEAQADKLSQEMPSRYAHKRAEQYRAITAAMESAREVLAFFDMGTARLNKKIDARMAGQDQAAVALGQYRAKLTEQAEKKGARELNERTAKNIAQAEDYLSGRIKPLRFFDLALHSPALDTLPADLRARFVAAVEENNGQLIKFWQEGKDVKLPHDVPTLLRAESPNADGHDQEMVTSHGARVPLDDARRTYRFALICKAKGWHRNGETHAIGAYQLDAVNEVGVIAGCHRVTWTEIERFATAQGWDKETAK